MAQGTRIRYTKASDDNLLTEDYLGGVGLYRGIIIPFERKARVDKLENGVYTVYKERVYTSHVVAKRFIKEVLKEVGVKFCDETRPKRTKVYVSE